MDMSCPKFFRCLTAMMTGVFLVTLSACKKEEGPPDAIKADNAVGQSASFLKASNYQRALDALAPALQLHPDDPIVINLHGAILTKMKDYDGARACYEKALKVSPGFFAARYNLGALLALQEQWDPAITYFRNLLIEAPNNELVEYKLLLLLLHQDAEPDLQQKLFPSDIPSNTPAWYYACAARSYKKGDRQEAAKYIDVAQSVFSDKTDIFQEELDESGLNKLNK
jgi:Flp pilus assembly protein TadD